MQLFGDGLGHLAGVTGDHGHLDAPVLQGRHGLAGFRADGVFEADGAQDTVPVDHVQYGGAAVHPGSRGAGQRFRLDGAELAQERGPADVNCPSVHGGSDAPAGEGREASGIGDGQVPLAGGTDDGPGDGVFTVGFHGSGQGQQAVSIPARNGGDVLQVGFASGQGTRLVEEDDVDGPHAFQSHPVLDQDPGAGGLFGGDGDDQGDGQAQGMRAGDHQDGDGAGDRLRDAAQHGPDDEGDDARAGGEVEQEPRGPVGQRLGLGGGCLRLGHQALDAGQRSVLPDGGHADPDGVVRGDGSGHHVVSWGAGNGFGFAGDHGFVELGLPVDDGSVGRHAGTGADQDDVAFTEFGDGYGLRASVGDAVGFIREQGREGVQRALRGTEGPHFDPVAQQHDRDQQRQFPPEVQVEPADAQAGDPGRDKGHGDGHGDQQHHPGAPGLQFLQAALEERLASVEENHCSQHGRNPG